MNSELAGLSDEELMTMYQNGDANAFKALYERHSGKIYRFLQRRVSPKEKLIEIYQEVFIKIHKSKQLYNKSFPLLPWILTVTRSVMLDEFRKDKKITQLELEGGRLQVISQVDFIGRDETSRGEAKEMALAKLKQLPEVQQIAIQMRYLDEKTFEEIAESLKTTSVNVRQIISRGIKRLKELINEGDRP